LFITKMPFAIKPVREIVKEIEAIDKKLNIVYNTVVYTSDLTAKGDIYAASGINTVEVLNAGTNDYVLTADSTELTGLKWSNTLQTNITSEASTRLANDNLLDDRLDNLTTTTTEGEVLTPPKLTIIQRDSINQVAGMVIYNDDTDTIETSDGVNWNITMARKEFPQIITPHNLTSNTSNPNFTTTISSHHNSGFDAWHPFDGDFSSRWLSEFNCYNTSDGLANNRNTFGGVNGAWIKIELDRARRFTKYQIARTDELKKPIQWRILTSLDDITYTVSATQATDYVYTTSIQTYSADILMPIPTVAKYIVLHVTKIPVGMHWTGISELNFDGVTALGPVKIYDYSINQNASRALMVTHTDGGMMTLGRPMINAAESFSTSHINYTTMYPSAMLAPITAVGGVNKCWGQTASYIADTDLLAGRLVSLADQTVGTDNTNKLKIGYIKIGSAVIPAITPIGVTQHDCLAGAEMVVCILGFTSVISITATPVGGAERGSVVLAGTDIDLGKVRIGTASAVGQARIGYVAQSNLVAVGDPVLIYYRGFFQA
jgi:hypothetical protein